MGVVEATAELKRVFEQANQELFDGQLPDVELTIQSKGRRNALGWFTTDKLWQNGKTRKHEINLSAEGLNRSLGEIVATVIHEMVHLGCSYWGIKDTSGSSGYHNKRFAGVAEKMGLVVEKGPKGFAYTSPGEWLSEWAMQFDAAAFNSFRMEVINQTRAATKMKKWSCGCTIIRCATDLQASCEACGEMFRLEV